MRLTGCLAALALAAAAAPAAALVAAPSACPVQAEARDQALAAVARAWDALVAAGFEGAAAISRDGRLVFCGASGMADADRAFTATTTVDIASISKPVTAMALVLLEHRGALSVDDPLSRWFPRAPSDKADLPLWRLMTHSSGMADLPDGIDDRTRITPEAMAERILAQPVVMAPGEDWSYSNGAYNLLGQVVEQASGRSLDAFLREDVLAPAGVTGGLDPARLTDLPAGMRTRQGWLPSPGLAEGPLWGLWGAGGLYLSAPDLALLFDAFLQGRIVPAEVARRAALERRFDVGDLGYYSLMLPTMTRMAEGLHFHDRAQLYFHAGAGDHSTAQVRWYPSERLVIAAVSNIGVDPGVATPNRIDVPRLDVPNGMSAADALDRAYFGVSP